MMRGPVHVAGRVIIAFGCDIFPGCDGMGLAWCVRAFAC